MNKRQVNIRNRDDTSSQDRGRPVPIQEAMDKLVALQKSRGEGNPFNVTSAERIAEVKKKAAEAKAMWEAMEKAAQEIEEEEAAKEKTLAESK